MLVVPKSPSQPVAVSRTRNPLVGCNAPVREADKRWATREVLRVAHPLTWSFFEMLYIMGKFELDSGTAYIIIWAITINLRNPAGSAILMSFDVKSH